MSVCQTNLDACRERNRAVDLCPAGPPLSASIWVINLLAAEGLSLSMSAGRGVDISGRMPDCSETWLLGDFRTRKEVQGSGKQSSPVCHGAEDRWSFCWCVGHLCSSVSPNRVLNHSSLTAEGGTYFSQSVTALSVLTNSTKNLSREWPPTSPRYLKGNLVWPLLCRQLYTQPTPPQGVRNAASR